MAILIITIAAATFVALFAGFNIGNNCDVSLMFHTFKDIPVFVTALVSFAVGAAVSLPIAIRCRTKKKDKPSAAKDKAALRSSAKNNGIRPMEAKVSGTEAKATDAALADTATKEKGFSLFGRKSKKDNANKGEAASPTGNPAIPNEGNNISPDTPDVPIDSNGTPSPASSVSSTPASFQASGPRNH